LAKNTYSLWQKGEIVKSAQEERSVEEQRNRDLKKKLEFSQSQQFIERQAREKLGLAKPGETVVIMSQSPATQSGVIEVLPNWKRWLNLFF